MDLKKINIGLSIQEGVAEKEIEMERICKFLNCSEEEVLQMYASADLDTEVLLRWSKLLEYDFFRLYSQHLILYSPSSSRNYVVATEKKENSFLPQFRKNIYTKEIIEFIIGKFLKGEMTKSQITKEYRIPKTTLYKWLHKYKEIYNDDKD
ncbi:transposase [Chryseobacterium sp. SIMBA_029]|uniref:transposase n=1 Tax=Chryseobacterium sp. SIMBA_029 TaxID=3085772 RepID=UPI0039787018